MKKKKYPIPSKAELERMMKVDVRDVDINEVTDISEIEIDESLSLHGWFRSWTEQTGNPYLFKAGKTIVKMGS